MNSKVISPARLRGNGAFAAICLGQMVSLFGSHLTSFVLGVWVYQHTRSATDFSLISFFAIVPEILFSALAGAIVDRCDRRRVMIAGNLGAAVCTFSLVLFALAGRLALWPVYTIVALSSACQAVQYPALSASTPRLVSARHLSRANSAVEFGSAIGLLVAPVTAALFLKWIGFRGIFLFNVVTFAVAIAALVVSEIPALPADSVGAQRPGLWREALEGWNYMKEHRAFLGLVVLFAAVNFSFGTVQVLLPPLVLSFASSMDLGKVMSCAGAGLMSGSLFIGLWGGPRRKVRAILWLVLIQGLVLFLGARRPTVSLIGTAAFVFSVCTIMIFVMSQTIWQTQIPQAIQGRAFAIRRLVAWSTLPIAYLAAGPLADKVFGPLLAPQGLLAGPIGPLIGIGEGRGIALLFVVMGALMVTAACVARGYRPFRDLETLLLAGRETAKQAG